MARKKVKQMTPREMMGRGVLLPLFSPTNQNEERFSAKVLFNSYLIDFMENKKLKKDALQCIPVEELNIKATQTLSVLNDGSCLEDCLILELLQWFKFYFFSWVDAPICDTCKQPTKMKEVVEPTQEETVWLAKTVENYFCSACNKFVRFPRYNHPRKLLETRRGRCGEWGICFTLICRALDLNVRLVIDWSDHVWTEFYSSSRQRFIHCDPCENVYDQPLMYELGWKKKLYLIIAFSKDEIQDVTWRYSCNFAQIHRMRAEFQFRDIFILSWIVRGTVKCRMRRPGEELKPLLERQAAELAQMLTPPVQNNEVLGGRTSGSAAWRIARGEISDVNMTKPYVFNLSDIEVENRYFLIQYSIAQDEYVRVSDNQFRCAKWSTYTLDAKNVFRKVENDWRMAYLSRLEGTPMGKIVWKFCFKDTGLVIQTLKLNLISTTFHDGRVKWCISLIKPSGEHFEKIYYSSVQETFSDNENFKGADGLLISAELFGGSGEQSWQHAQLFRQPLESVLIPFKVEIYFEKLAQADSENSAQG